MATRVLDSGAFVLTVRYLDVRRSTGLCFYYRKVPTDLRASIGKMFVRRSLKTRDLKTASKLIARYAQSDDNEWAALRAAKAHGTKLPSNPNQAEAILSTLGLERGEAHRDTHGDASDALWSYFEERHPTLEEALRNAEDAERDEVTKAIITDAQHEAWKLLHEKPDAPRRYYSDAHRLYLKEHPKGPQKKFIDQHERARSLLVRACGDLLLTDYRRKHAHAFRDLMIDVEGLQTTSARRYLRALNAVFSKGLREFDLADRSNPFASLTIVGEGNDSTPRVPFSREELQTLSRVCIEANDAHRWLLAMLIDTGCRLSEVAGLRRDDVSLDGTVPYLIIRPHLKLGRTLKNANSERLVPLVGVSLWGAQRAYAVSASPSGWLFPQYAADHNIKAGSASATLNRWLKRKLKVGKSLHSLRHSHRDRMRAAHIPLELQNLIGGWGKRDVGQSYGDGYPLESLREQLLGIVLPAVDPD